MYHQTYHIREKEWGMGCKLTNKLDRRKWLRWLIWSCCSWPSSVYLASGRLGWYTAALQTRRSRGLSAVNSFNSTTKSRTDWKDARSSFIIVKLLGSKPSTSATALILSMSRHAQMMCQLPVSKSHFVVDFPNPEEVPVMTQIFLSPNLFWPPVSLLKDGSDGNLICGV